MKAAVLHAAKDVRIDTVPDPEIEKPTDAIVRITYACICGSDLWPYRGRQESTPGARLGHEWMGVVEEVGSDVRQFKKGDTVIAPFAFSDGTCEYCRNGLPTSCLHGGFWGGDNGGGQAEAVRAVWADGTLMALPSGLERDLALQKRILPLTDVMGTGHHAAVLAGVVPGSTVAVIGDGAVGLCAVLAARRLGAGRIIMYGHRRSRVDLARSLGATDVVQSRGAAAIDEVLGLTDGGTTATLECVGEADALNMAIAITRPGGAVGSVGVPHHEQPIDFTRLFRHNIALRAGVAPVREYIPALLRDVLDGKLDPSPVLDFEIALKQVPEGYEKMDNRTHIKACIKL